MLDYGSSGHVPGSSRPGGRIWVEEPVLNVDKVNALLVSTSVIGT